MAEEIKKCEEEQEQYKEQEQEQYKEQEQEEQEKKIHQISNQTTYSRELILQKLEEHNGDVISIIREYMGVKPKVEKKVVHQKSVNQEIYRQIRMTFDDGMRKYREKNPINIEEVKNNLRESEERKNKIN